MRSSIHGAILALALSVSAAPVEKRSATESAIDPTTPQVSRGRPSGASSDEQYGPPMFFGDSPSTYKGQLPSSDASETSPSANKPSNIPSFANGNSTTTTSPGPPALTTSTSHSLAKRMRQASRLITPNVNSYISKAGTVMFGMQNPVCSAVTLIFARGTTEVGNMGTCVGPELASALRAEIPSLSVQGVDYPANSYGNTEYGASGGPYMAMLAREARRQCPDTKIVLAGYSQGARCIHGALEKSEHPVDGREIAAVVAFGDPLNGANAFKDVRREKVLQVCGDSDDRCQSGEVDQWVHGGHVSYGQTAEEVARWIKKTVL
jgi:cutinase